ncbi:MAG: lipid-A-disaccharide synthase N-terminal domain-containing protein [Acidobacteria bacterium]|nr:lipid-A-disaccharide synthase N-terminal domain-containing protein [Acidobacteriota bacterium]
MMKDLTNPWVLFGLFGQVLFFSRWIVQWVASERKKESHVPLSFWILSLIGGTIVLIYGIQQKDIVIIVGQTVGVANFTRNIVLIRKKHLETL